MRNLLITTAAAALTVGGLIAAPIVDAHPGHPGVDNGTECYDADWALITCPPAPDALTVDGTDYPLCAEEDCSDQPGQVGVWIDPDTGNHWLSIGERSYQVLR